MLPIPGQKWAKGSFRRGQGGWQGLGGQCRGARRKT